MRRIAGRVNHGLRDLLFSKIAIPPTNYLASLAYRIFTLPDVVFQAIAQIVAEIILLPLLDLLLWILFYIIGYGVGWIVLTVFTAGSIPLGPMLDIGTEGKNGPRYALTYVRHGRKTVDPWVVVGTGLLTVVLVGIEVYMLYHGA